MKGSLKQKYIILFDESGTPSFGEQKDQEFFLGVSVLYDSADEDKMLFELDRSMGLSNKQSLKNKEIKNDRAINIAECVGSQNLRVEARASISMTIYENAS